MTLPMTSADRPLASSASRVLAPRHVRSRADVTRAAPDKRSSSIECSEIEIEPAIRIRPPRGARSWKLRRPIRSLCGKIEIGAAAGFLERELQAVVMLRLIVQLVDDDEATLRNRDAVDRRDRPARARCGMIERRIAAAIRFMARERWRAMPGVPGKTGAVTAVAEADGVIAAPSEPDKGSVCCVPLAAETASDPSGNRTSRTSMPKTSDVLAPPCHRVAR